jgi:anti-sigma factor RsiW
MTSVYNDEQLVAYVDGELPAAEALMVEQYLADNENARAFVDDLRAIDRQLREDADDLAFAGGLDELKFRLSKIADQPIGQPRRRFYGVHTAAIAATVVAMIVGLVFGYLAATTRLDNRLAALEIARLEDQRMLKTAISAALEKVKSGQVVNWQNPNTGTRALLRPIRTFKAVDGSWCREYERTMTISGKEERIHAIACRTGKADWQTRLVSEKS